MGDELLRLVRAEPNRCPIEIHPESTKDAIVLWIVVRRAGSMLPPETMQTTRCPSCNGRQDVLLLMPERYRIVEESTELLAQLGMAAAVALGEADDALHAVHELVHDGGLHVRHEVAQLLRRVVRRKGRRGARKADHVIPLSDRALSILSDLPREGEYIFPGGILPSMAQLARATEPEWVISATGPAGSGSGST